MSQPPVPSLFSQDWLPRLVAAGTKAVAEDRDAALRHERWLLRELVFYWLEQERAEQDIPSREMLAFFAFCQPRVRLSHAQILQDLWVLFMSDSKCGGFFVEFGACDGQVLSNTRLLEEVYGWQGILAEPNPIWHEDLRRNRRAVLDTDCVAALSGEELEFLCVDDMPELSRLANIVPDDAHEREGARLARTAHRVNTVSLNDLLERHNAPDVIDYLSIDTEGSEYEILRHVDFSRYSFRWITVEHAGEVEKRAAIKTLLEGKGYRRWHPELSRWDDWYEFVGRRESLTSSV